MENISHPEPSNEKPSEPEADSVQNSSIGCLIGASVILGILSGLVCVCCAILQVIPRPGGTEEGGLAVAALSIALLAVVVLLAISAIICALIYFLFQRRT